MGARIRVGIIGWNYPEWRGLAYPSDARPATFLHDYARLFPTVEVSASYYRTPDAETLAAWARETPDGFVFSLKVPAWITKRPDDEENRGKLAWFLERLSPLRKAGKLGTLVAQFPPFFRHDTRAPALRRFLAMLPEEERWAIELRHPSWWREETYDALRAAGATLVWNVVESGRAPPVVTTDALYLRLFGDHALPRPYDSRRRDAQDELGYWVERIRDEGRRARRVDVLVSKYLEGYAPGSAATLCEMLGLPEPRIGDARGRQEARQTTLEL